ERVESRRETPPRETRNPERPRNSRDVAGAAASQARVFGAPIGEPLRPATIPLDAPINSAPTTASTAPAGGSSFPGRTIEAGDKPAVPSSAMQSIQQAQQSP